MTETIDAIGEIDAVVADVVQTDPGEIDDDTVFGEDVAMESLDYVEIAELVEFELGVTVTDEDLEEIESVGDLKRTVDRRLSE